MLWCCSSFRSRSRSRSSQSRSRSRSRSKSYSPGKRRRSRSRSATPPFGFHIWRKYNNKHPSWGGEQGAPN
ncbi:hypothetical protein AB205_0006190, partial [Aquarana catesbeiana]